MTYWAVPHDRTVDRQLAVGGFNTSGARKRRSRVAERKGLTGSLREGLLSTASLEDPAGVRSSKPDSNGVQTHA